MFPLDMSPDYLAVNDPVLVFIFVVLRVLRAKVMEQLRLDELGDVKQSF